MGGVLSNPFSCIARMNTLCARACYTAFSDNRGRRPPPPLPPPEKVLRCNEIRAVRPAEVCAGFQKILHELDRFLIQSARATWATAAAAAAEIRA